MRREAEKVHRFMGDIEPNQVNQKVHSFYYSDQSTGDAKMTRNTPINIILSSFIAFSLIFSVFPASQAYAEDAGPEAGGGKNRWKKEEGRWKQKLGVGIDGIISC